MVNERIEIGGQVWLVRQARSRTDALNEIGHARATGSIGSRTTVDETRCGGTVYVLADVHRLNEDGTEAKPYG